jgi:hypothetical protein
VTTHPQLAWIAMACLSELGVQPLYEASIRGTAAGIRAKLN